MNFGNLKEKLDDQNQKLLMYFPVPRTGSISMSHFISESDSIFTYRDYSARSSFYEPFKTIPPKPQPGFNKDDWDLKYFLSYDQSFFVNQLSKIQDSFCKNIFKHDSKKIFSIVRHPVDRLFSIWNYCTNSSYEYQLFSLEEDDYKIKDFNQFVKEFATNGLPKKYPSKMFLKMSEILDLDLGDKLLVFKFENIKECVDYLRSEYNVQGKHLHSNQSKKTISKNMSEETINNIYSLYKEDFEKFGYEL